MKTRSLQAAGLALMSAGVSAGTTVDGWEVLNQPAKSFSVKDLSGKALRSTALSGKIVVVDFWATWCAPCVKELPDLVTFHSRVKDRPDVVFLSFNVTDGRETLEGFVEKKGISFPIYLADAVAEDYEVAQFPTKLVIDMRKGKGVLRFRREGETPLASLEARVSELRAAKD